MLGLTAAHGAMAGPKAVIEGEDLDEPADGIDDRAVVDLHFAFAFPPVPDQAGGEYDDGSVELAEEQLRRASAILCDATDGQLKLRNVTIGGSPLGLENADVIWFPEGVLARSGGNSSTPWGEPGNLVRLDWIDGIYSITIAHELGHALLGIVDSYDSQRQSGKAYGIGAAFDLSAESTTYTSLMAGGKGLHQVCRNTGTNEAQLDQGEPVSCLSNASCNTQQDFHCKSPPDLRSEFLLNDDFDLLAGNSSEHPCDDPQTPCGHAGTHLLFAGHLGQNASIDTQQDWWTYTTFAQAEASNNKPERSAEFIDEVGDVSSGYYALSSHKIRFYTEHIAKTGSLDLWRMYAFADRDDVEEADEEELYLLEFTDGTEEVDHLDFEFDLTSGWSDQVNGSSVTCYSVSEAMGHEVVGGQTIEGQDVGVVKLMLPDWLGDGGASEVVVEFGTETTIAESKFGSCNTSSGEFQRFKWSADYDPPEMIGTRFLVGSYYDDGYQQLGWCENCDEQTVSGVNYNTLWNDVTMRFEGAYARVRAAERWVEESQQPDNEHAIDLLGGLTPIKGADWDMLDYSLQIRVHNAHDADGDDFLIGDPIALTKPDGAVDPGSPGDFCDDAHTGVNVVDVTNDPDTVAVVMDASGSMFDDLEQAGTNGKVRDWARAGAKNWAALVSDSPLEVSLWQFPAMEGDSPAELAPLERLEPQPIMVTPSGSEHSLADFQEEITLIPSNGDWTPAGRAIIEVADVLTAEPGEKAIYLLTDGKNNVDPTIAEAQEYIEDLNANGHSIMLNITPISTHVYNEETSAAVATGGEVFAAEDPREVPNAFMQLYGKLRAEDSFLLPQLSEVAWNVQGYPQAEVFTFEVEDDVDRFHILLTNLMEDLDDWDLAFLLDGPGAEEYTHEDPEFETDAARHYGRLTISEPAEGTWTFTIQAVNPAPLAKTIPDRVQVMAHLDHLGPRCDVAVSTRRATNDEQRVEIMVTANWMGVPIEADVEYTANVLRPDRSSVEVELEETDEGSFHGFFDEYRGDGRYRIDATCTVGDEARFVPGDEVDPDDEEGAEPFAFHRESTHSFIADLGYYWFDSPGGDCDLDGYTNAEEGVDWQGQNEIAVALLTDTDGDEVPDACDPDSDNDGLPDLHETDDDFDNDGIDDRLDQDSDNDGDVDGADPIPNWSESTWLVAWGDLDGDGALDRIEGDPLYDDETGRVKVQYGSDGALEYWDRDSTNINETTEIGDLFGASIAVGDFDDDGYDDIVVGVPKDDFGSLTDAGSIHVIYGSSSGLTGTGDQFLHQDTTNIGDTGESFDQFGLRLASGDYDCDGYADIAVGIPFEDASTTSNAGGVHVIYGSSGGVSTVDTVFYQGSASVDGSAETHDNFGHSLATGLFDSGTCDDLVIGAVGEDVGSVSNGGFVHVLYGNSSGLAGTSEFSFDQNTSGIAGTSESNDYLGRRFWIGDWNDDGYQDLVAFVPGDGCGTNTKGFHIVYGSSSGLTTSGNSIACAVGIGPDVF